jgi:PhoH-like ATPase
MAKKTYVLDTNVYLTDANSITSFGNNDILIPFKVLEEIDKHKKRQDSVGLNARRIIRILDELRVKGSLKKGVRIAKGKGIVFARTHVLSLLPSEFDRDDPDNTIISTALAEKEENPNKKVVVVTRDINMRIKCDALGLPSEDYQTDQAVTDSELLYSGFVKYLVDDQIINQFYDGEPVYAIEDDIKLFPNQFVMLVSNANDKRTALSKFLSYADPLRKIVEYKNVWGVKPRNKEQSFALDLLMDFKVPIVSLVGKAGSGKTLCAVAAGLQQTIEDDSEAQYKRIIVSRPIQPMGKDIGYLPGTIEEKMSPWLAPIQDNLEFLMGDKKTLDMYIDEGIIEVEALTYIRGRSIANAFIVIDEAQQLTKHEIKTILTRVGEGTKIVFTGDIEQIDNVYVDETSNGLTFIVEKFKEHDVAGHVILKKGERSKVATLAAKIL